MSLPTLSGLRRATLIAKQFCSKCDNMTDHMLLRRWTEESGNPDTFIKAESWICCFCDTIHEKRSEERKPTEESTIIRRLLKLCGDYEQIRNSTLEVVGNTMTLRLNLFPWKVVQAAKRVEDGKEKGFYSLGDLWRLEQHGLLKGPLEEDGSPSPCQPARPEPRTRVIRAIRDDGWA